MTHVNRHEISFIRLSDRVWTTKDSQRPSDFVNLKQYIKSLYGEGVICRTRENVTNDPTTFRQNMERHIYSGIGSIPEEYKSYCMEIIFLQDVDSVDFIMKLDNDDYQLKAARNFYLYD